MKKHLMACAVVAGLATATWATAPQNPTGVPGANAGYLVYKMTTDETGGIGQAGAQAAGAGAGALIVGGVSKLVVMKLGAKAGSLALAFAGPAGIIVGAGLGAM